MSREKFSELPPKSAAEVRPLHRGVWAERLVDGMELPIGGSLFSDELTTKLTLDFSSFESQLGKFTADNLRSIYEKHEQATIDWLAKVGSDVDPYLFFIANSVQRKTEQLLEIDPAKPDDDFNRNLAYAGKESPKLSELKGKTMCAERAAMGQYLLARAGVHSAYIGGVTMNDARNEDEYPGPHSFLAVYAPGSENEPYIFDIARPRSQNNLPRVLKPTVPFTYKTLQGKKELLVKTTEVLQGGELWFGVGEPVAGEHEIAE